MINIKIKIVSVAIALMLIVTNVNAMACTFTGGECADLNTYAIFKPTLVAADNLADQAAAQAESAQAIAAAAQLAAQAAVEAAAKAINNFDPTTTAFPIVPGIPDVPVIPEIPVIPAVPVILDIPAIPDVPVIPGIPVIPDAPAFPVPTGLSIKVVDPTNGDIIETSFDPATGTTTTNMICSRKDSPDTLTVTSPSGTDTLITADGDTFTCNVGYYGNAISPVSLSAGYQSSLKILLRNTSEMTGEINNNHQIQFVSMELDKTSKWIVKGTSYLSILIDEDATFANVVDNGNTIYYDASNNRNSWLGGKSYSLCGGGKLIPLN